MTKYIEEDAVQRIMSAVESADQGIVFFVQNGHCVVYDGVLISAGERRFEDWFFHNPEGEPTLENVPEDMEGAILAVIPYEPREIAD